MTDPEVGRPAPMTLAVVGAVGLVLALVVVAIGRLALLGWAGVAADDARYVFVGLSTLDGHGPVTPTGNVFLLRSPVYGLILAAGSRIAGGEPIDGARIVAVVLTLAGLLAAVRLGWLLGGPVAASGTAVAILAVPLVWSLLPTLRIDLPQAAGVCGVLLALHRPTARRWALAGALLGLTVLIKETVLLLALAPLAFAGSIPRHRLAILWGTFLVAAAVVAGWWWVVVWVQAGAIFPLNAIGVIENRDVGADLRVDGFGIALAAVFAAAWLVVAGAARRDRQLRPLLVAALCLVPPAAYATLNGLNSRNYAGLAVLSTIALGVAAARVLAPMRAAAAPRASRHLGGQAWFVAVVALSLAAVAAGQMRVGDPSEPLLPGQVARWLKADAPAGSRVVMTFRYSEVVALDLYGSASVPALAAVRVASSGSPADFVWIGLRDRQLFGYARADWEDALRAPGTTHLVLAGPHPLTPRELMAALDRGDVPGLTMAQTFEAGGDWATVYRVTPGAVRASRADVAVRLSPAAAIAWLDLAAGRVATGTGAAEEEAVRRLAGSGAIVVGSDTDALAGRLAGLACLAPLPQPTVDEARLIPAGPGCEPG